MSVIANNIIAGAAGQGGAAFQIDRSLRFDSSSSGYLSRTPSSAGDRKTWTLSFWVKLCGSSGHLISAGNDAFQMEIRPDGQYLIANSGCFNNNFSTNVFTDYSAWQHFVIEHDATNTYCKIYVNGSLQKTITATNADGAFNNNTAHNFNGRSTSLDSFTDFYLAQVHFIDGQALSASDFGEYDSDGNWNPKEYSGSYGGNSFKLDFSDNTSTTTIAEDSSGEDNDFTATNISVSSGAGNDSLLDSPTNYDDGTNVGGNYATLNPLDGNPTGLSNGNLDATSANAYPTIIPGSGSWYYEVDGTGYTWDGTRGNFTPRSGSHNFGQRPFSGTPTSGHVSLCTTNLPTPTIADGSKAMDVRHNLSAQFTISDLAFETDLVWARSTSHSEYWINADVLNSFVGGLRFNHINDKDTTTAISNVGSTGYQSDSNWFTTNRTYVTFNWDAGTTTVTDNDAGTITPTGVRANQSTGCSIVTYTGTGSSASVGHGLNAAPAFYVTKRTDDTSFGNWTVYHSSIGTQYLEMNTTAAAGTDANRWSSAATSTVFNIGSGGNVNVSGGDFVAYCFAPVEGYSAMGSYTGNGSSDGPFIYTGFKPAFLMVKRTDSTASWVIMDSTRNPFNPVDKYVRPDLNNGEGTGSYFNFLSNGFNVRTTAALVNASSGTFVYVAFAEHPLKTARAA